LQAGIATLSAIATSRRYVVWISKALFSKLESKGNGSVQRERRDPASAAATVFAASEEARFCFTSSCALYLRDFLVLARLLY
jgi:hypothetical protein